MRRSGPDNSDGSADRLLAAATRLFTARGFPGVSVRELVQAAGVSRPVLYYHFGSKEGLLLAAIRSVSASYEDALRLAATSPGTAAERIRRVVRAHVTAGCRAATRSAARRRAGAPSLEPCLAKAIEWVQALVANGIERGEFRPCDQEDAACALVGAAQACSAAAPARLGRRVDPDRLDRVVSVILRGLSPQAAP